MPDAGRVHWRTGVKILLLILFGAPVLVGFLFALVLPALFLGYWVFQWVGLFWSQFTMMTVLIWEVSLMIWGAARLFDRVL